MSLEYDEIRAVAYHETAHAWLGAVIGVDMKKIRMWKEFMAGQAGEVTIDRAKQAGFFVDDIDMMVLFYISGQEGHSLFLVNACGISMEEAREHCKPGSRHDRRVARSLLACTPHMKRSDGERLCDAVLLRHWNAYAALSERMSDLKRLKVAEVTGAADRESTDGLGVRKIQKVTPEMMATSTPGRG
jgi:hypothetical protein